MEQQWRCFHWDTDIRHVSYVCLFQYWAPKNHRVMLRNTSVVQTWTAWLQLSRRWVMPGCGGSASYCQTQLRIVWPSSESLSRNGQSRVWPGSSLQSAGQVYLCLPPFTTLLSTSIPPTAACIAGNPVVNEKIQQGQLWMSLTQKCKAPVWLAICRRGWYDTNRPLAQYKATVAWLNFIAVMYIAGKLPLKI